MADELHLELVAADRVVWSGEADMVLTRTTEGELGVMAHHIPLMGVLVPGTVEVRATGGADIVAAVDGGFLSVAHNRVSILAEHIELGQDIDLQQARADLESAEHADELRHESEKVVQEAQHRLLAAQARVAAAERAS